MKRILLFLCCLGWAFTSQAQKQLSLASPDGRLTTTIQIGEKLTYDIRLDGQQVLAPSPISMTLSDGEV